MATRTVTTEKAPTARSRKSAAIEVPKTTEVPKPVEVPKTVEVPKPGLLLRSYRLSLTSIEWTSVTVGGSAIGVLRVVGLPKGATKKLQSGQASAMRGVTGWSDDVGTKVAHGVGRSKTLAAQGARQSVKSWARGMKFFITLH
jgi:hypothetical protein